jgi:hypothetical protein
MNGLLIHPARAICHLFALSMVLMSTTGLAATTAYVKTTEQLDLKHVRLIIVAPPASQDALRHRVMTHFSRLLTGTVPCPADIDPQPEASRTHLSWESIVRSVVGAH